MITEDEKQEIIGKAVERVLLLIPETVGNMMAHQAALSKYNREFYAKHPEFKEHKQAVASVIEMMEGKSPLDNYENLLTNAVPEIRRRIGTLKNLDMLKVHNNPDRDFSKGFGHGEI